MFRIRKILFRRFCSGSSFMCRWFFIRSCVLFFLCLCAGVPLCPFSFAQQEQKICFQDYCFSLEIPDTPQKKMKGLMFRDSMPEDHGMLFIFDADGFYSFWMKNTLIPLDMVWLDSDLTVVHIETDVPVCPGDPCPSYRPGAPARYVLELCAGTVQKIGLTTGDVLWFETWMRSE